MKKCFLFICVAVLGVVLPSCSRMADIDKRVDDATMRTLTINLDEIDLSSQLSAMRNSVSFEDVQKYVSLTSPQTKGGEKDYEIIPQVDEENDTIFYLVKYEKGWKLIASDRRVQPILAENDNSSFNQSFVSDASKEWLGILATDMKIAKHLADEDLGLSPEEVDLNKKYWASFCETNSIVKSILPSTKGLIFPGGDGQFVPVDTFVFEEYYDEISHLISTHWRQDEPYNACLPFRTDTMWLRAPAGCTTIAAAQMLYFLHYEIGRPVYAPESCVCVGTIGEGNYEFTFGNPSSTIWNTTGWNFDSITPFIAKVADLLGVEFGNDGSSASFSDMDDVFDAYNITYTRDDYDDAYVRSSLLNGFPVIARADGTRTPHLGGLWYTYSHGHDFIIDSYKRYRTVTEIVFRWVYDDANQGNMHPEVEDQYVFTYSSPHISYIRMNWGWGSGTNSDDNTWFTLNGNWHIDINANNPRDYDYNREMIYGFGLAN